MEKQNKNLGLTRSLSAGNSDPSMEMSNIGGSGDQEPKYCSVPMVWPVQDSQEGERGVQDSNLPDGKTPTLSNPATASKKEAPPSVPKPTRPESVVIRMPPIPPVPLIHPKAVIPSFITRGNINYSICPRSILVHNLIRMRSMPTMKYGVGDTTKDPPRNVTLNRGRIKSPVSSATSETSGTASNTSDEVEDGPPSNSYSSLIEALNLEHASMRVGERGGGDHGDILNLSQSLPSLSVTQSLAFPRLASDLDERRRRRESDADDDSEESGSTTFAKVLSIVMFVLVSILILGLTYKFSN